MRLQKRNPSVFFLFLLVFSFRIFANEEEKEKNLVVYQKKTVLDFSDVVISGEWMRPDGAYVKNRKKTKFDVLIEMRSNFRSELIKSASEL